MQRIILLFLSLSSLAAFVLMTVTDWLHGIHYFGERNAYSLSVHPEEVALANNDSFILRIPKIAFLVLPITVAVIGYARWRQHRPRGFNVISSSEPKQ